MNNKKEMLKRVKRGIAGGTAALMLFGGTGCAKSNENNEPDLDSANDAYFETIDYNGNVGTIEGHYKYVLDVDGFENSELELPETSTQKILGNTYQTNEFGDNTQNDLSAEEYVNSMPIVWPSCFDSYLSENSQAEMYSKFDCNYKEEYLSTEIGDVKVVHVTMVAKKDLNMPVNDIPYAVPQEPINKGDTMQSTAVFLKVDDLYFLIGYKQTGVGADTARVVNNTVGDLDKGLTTISEYGYERPFMINPESLDEIIASINEKATEKQK